MQKNREHVFQAVRSALQGADDAALRSAVEGVHPADLAELFVMLTDDEQSRFVFSLPARTVAEVLVELDAAERGDVVEDLDDEALSDLVIQMLPDDAADVLGELTDAQREEVLEHIPDAQADQIEELLGHEEDTAGGIMTPQLVALPATATVAEAVERVRAVSEDEEIHYVYVLGEDETLAGIVPLRRLVTNLPDTRLSTIADRNPVSVHVDDDQEQVANKIRKYDIAAVPVLDDEGRLVGRITHDDVLDVATEEAAEDIYYMAGTEAAELEEDSVFRAAFIRLRWLMACFIGTAISGTVMAVFETNFPEELFGVLVLFVPMMGAMAGNSGIQISTVIIRGFATNDIASTRLRMAFGREGSIALVMAPVCGIAAALIASFGVPFLQSRGYIEGSINLARLATSVGLGMITAILVSSLMAISLPHVFRRVGVDPAIASGPIVTTTNDIVSVTMYFVVGMLILG